MYQREEQDDDVVVTLLPKKRPRRNYLATAVFSFLLGALVTFIATDSLLGINPGNVLDSRYSQKLNKMSQSERLIAEGSVIDVARRVKPSVVNIQTQQVKSGGWRNQSVDGVGSGIILRSDGYIMTNEHVVANAKKITVNVRGEKLPAEVVGLDGDTDVAVVKINRSKLPVPQFGSARNLKVGELAVAVGSPFGFQRSVTAGVVSAVNRNVTVGDELETPRTYANLIQTDAAINPGNSGGALSNRRGEIVGMNSLIYSTTGVSQGIGFAIPIDLAKKVAFQIIDKGSASHPFIGILGHTITTEVMNRQKLPVNQGVLVDKVLPDSPAEKAGIRGGDIVVGLNTQKIKSMDDLVGSVRSMAIGNAISVTLLRQGDRQKFELILVERPKTLN